jgi:hypothetical protein
MATAVAQIGTTDWQLTGIRTSSGTGCDHCGRRLKNLYTVVNRVTGQTLTVGRGCCKAVTGWDLSAAEAARILRAAERTARKDATWEAFAQAHPSGAHLIEVDMAAWCAAHSSGPGPAQDAHDLIRSGVVPPQRWESYLRDYRKRQHPSSTAGIKERTTSRMPEITYSQVQSGLVALAAATAAEESAARHRFDRVRAKVTEADRNYNAIRSLGFDPLTLADFNNVGQSLVGQARMVLAAANVAIELNGMALQAGRDIEHRHGRIDRAVASAPVPAANREAYNNRS